MGLTTYTLLSTTHTKDSPTLDLPDHESSAKAYLRRILARYPPSPPSSPPASTLELKHHHHYRPTQPISIPASLSRRRRQSSSSSSFSTTSKEEREQEKGEGLYKMRSNELAAQEKRASVVWAEMESERMLWGTFLGLG